jgi:putative hydrolase of the HAD superfamily
MSWVPSAVVFDLDGTLLDHTGATLGGLAALLETLGVADRTPDDVSDHWSQLEDEHFEAWRAGRVTFEEQRRARLRGFLPSVGREVVERDLDAQFAAYLDGYEAGWTAYDDAAAALARVRAAGCAVAVLTNGQQAQQSAKLAAIGLLGACGPVLASSSIGAAKPDGQAYAAACAAVGVDPSAALMVGDDLANDVLGARAAGMRALHLDRSGTHPVPERHRIRSLDDLVV